MQAIFFIPSLKIIDSIHLLGHVADMVRAQEAARFRIVISVDQVVKTCLFVVVVPAVAEGIQR